MAKRFDIFGSIRGRDEDAGGDIVTADWYVKHFTDCIEQGGMCPVEVVGKNRINKDLQIAQSRLAYTDPLGDILRKSLERTEPSEENGAAIMTMDSILTTKAKDRDGDIVEPLGLSLDLRMPLLWQHVPSQPVGGMIKVLRQDEDMVVLKSAIANTALGRDVATLIEVNALRISQGFKPTEAVPLSRKNLGNGKFKTNWHVKKGFTIEHSVVSIPSNAESIILAYSRKSLENDMTKHWAKGYFDNRPVIGTGFDFDNEEDEVMTKKMDDKDMASSEETKDESKKKTSGKNGNEGTHDHQEGFTEDTDEMNDEDSQPGDMSHKALDGKDGGCGDAARMAGEGKDDEENDEDEGDEDEVINKSTDKESMSGDDEEDDDSDESDDDEEDSEDDEEDDDDGDDSDGDDEESTDNDLKEKADWSESKEDKDFEEYVSKGMSNFDCPYIAGSYEWKTFQLQKLIADEMNKESYAINMTGTFESYCVFCVTEYVGRKYETKCYMVSYEESEDGEYSLGEIKEADVEKRVVAKHLELQAADRAEGLDPELVSKHCLQHIVSVGSVSEDVETMVKSIGAMMSAGQMQRDEQEFTDILNAGE